jgi:hypothetical protein
MLVDVVHQGRPGRQLRDPILLAVDVSTSAAGITLPAIAGVDRMLAYTSRLAAWR